MDPGAAAGLRLALAVLGAGGPRRGLSQHGAGAARAAGPPCPKTIAPRSPPQNHRPGTTGPGAIASIRAASVS